MNDRKRNGEKEKEEVMVELGRTDGIGARESRKERVHSLSLSLAQPRLRVSRSGRERNARQLKGRPGGYRRNEDGGAAAFSFGYRPQSFRIAPYTPSRFLATGAA